MLHRISRRLVAASVVPIALGAHATCEHRGQPAAPPIASLGKYSNLIVLPGSANMKLAEDIAFHLGVELGKIETAR